LSARAAAQLDYLGYREVLHYMRGKADWMVRGMPMEPAPPAAERMRALPFFVNNLAPWIRAGWIRLSARVVVAELTRDDLARLGPDDPAPPVAARGSIAAVVLDHNGILLGAIDRNAPGRRAIEAMNPGPQTIRPDMTLRLAAQLLRANPYLLVTGARGEYFGRYQPPAAGSGEKVQVPDA
jgi:hypothetical protein